MSRAQGLGPQLSFWPNLKRHLTVLNLILSPGKDKVQLLGALGTLKALQTLDVKADWDPDLPYRDLFGEEGVWKPHLTSLQIENLEHGEISLVCPKLAMAWFVHTNSLHITVEEAVLRKLSFSKCESMHLACTSPEKCLCNLTSLRVAGCSEVGSHLIEDISIMDKLEKLTYDNFPAISMLCTRFPHNLCDVCLCSSDWPVNLPRGLKELPKLKNFTFSSEYELWTITRSLAEFLPLDSLKSIKIGMTMYSAADLSKLKAPGLRKDSRHRKLANQNTRDTKKDTLEGTPSLDHAS